MAWLGRRRLLRELIPKGDRHLLGRMVVFPVSLPFRCPLFDGLRGWWGRPLLPLRLIFLLFPAPSSCPHLHPLPGCLHFYKGKMKSVRPSDDKKKNDERKFNNTNADGNRYLKYELQVSALDHHSMRATYRGWSNPYTSIAQMEFQGLNEWRPPDHQLWSDEHWLKRENDDIKTLHM